MKKLNKKYSIIIPVYNSENTIKKCLDNILCQNNELFEIIIVNDGSTDNTLKYCIEYQKKYNCINIINQNNQGPSVSRNKAIKASVGNYILFVDSDDYIEKDFFNIIEPYIKEDLDILKYNVNYHGDRVNESIFNTEYFQVQTGEKTIKQFIEDKKIFATPWMYIFKKELFINNGLYFSENHIHEDYGLIPCLIILAKKIRGIEYKGYNYIFNYNSLSTNQEYNQITRRAFDMLAQYDFLLDFSKNIKDKKLEKLFLKYILDNLLKKTKKLKDEELKHFNNELTKRKILK